MIRLIIFGLLSAGIFVVSKDDLRNPRAYGFYHFFAFEAILAAFLFNVLYWIENAFSVTQLVSWVLLFASLPMVLGGFSILLKLGQPENGLDTTALVTRGVYAYIRHPLYGSLLFFVWGVFFKRPSVLVGCLAGVASVFLLATAKVEQRENLERFGDDYAEYMQLTKMFVPFLW
ncbi:MAG: methyltransferase [Chloroflexota bacterium]|nr:methyltransferase [Chloroflexota bacterium]